eukprot:6461372-Amphidinium_carterae.1
MRAPLIEVGNRLQGLNLGGYGDALDDPLEQHAFRVAADPNDDPPFVVFASGSEFDESTMRLKACQCRGAPTVNAQKLLSTAMFEECGSSTHLFDHRSHPIAQCPQSSAF